MSYTMQHAKQQKLVAAMLSAMASLVLSGWLGWHIAPAAAATSGKYLGTKIVNVDHESRLDAVTITKVTVAGQQIQPGISGMREEERGTPFQADEDWLKNMSISLLNRTGKAIVCAQVDLFFPDTGDGTPARPITKYTITVGQRPESSAYYSNGSKIPPDPTKKPLLFAPGQTLVIPVADSIDAIESTIEGLGKMPLSQITRVNIRRSIFYFVDGSRWTYSGYDIPDPGHPGHFTKLAPTYFPARFQLKREEEEAL